MSKFNQLASYWGPLIPNEFNEYLFSDPVTFKVRWQDVNEKYYDEAIGAEIRVKGVIYTEESDLVTGGYIYLGNSAAPNPKTVNEAYIIKRIDRTKELRGSKTLYKLWL
jgi:hypothetical protein